MIIHRVEGDERDDDENDLPQRICAVLMHSPLSFVPFISVS
jgi:hypothetical protein